MLYIARTTLFNWVKRNNQNNLDNNNKNCGNKFKINKSKIDFIEKNKIIYIDETGIDNIVK
jgi:hypothetical protein